MAHLSTPKQLKNTCASAPEAPCKRTLPAVLAQAREELRARGASVQARQLAADTGGAAVKSNVPPPPPDRDVCDDAEITYDRYGNSWSDRRFDRERDLMDDVIEANDDRPRVEDASFSFVLETPMRQVGLGESEKGMMPAEHEPTSGAPAGDTRGEPEETGDGVAPDASRNVPRNTPCNSPCSNILTPEQSKDPIPPGAPHPIPPGAPHKRPRLLMPSMDEATDDGLLIPSMDEATDDERATPSAADSNPDAHGEIVCVVAETSAGSV